MGRYSFEVTKEAIMLFDKDESVVMPVTFEQIAILLNYQDEEIKQLKEIVEKLSDKLEEQGIFPIKLKDGLYFKVEE